MARVVSEKAEDATSTEAGVMSGQSAVVCAKRTSLINLFSGLDRRWLFAWAAILVVVTYLNLAHPEHVAQSQALSFIGILSCLVFAFSRAKKDPLLIIALSATALADIFLIILGQNLIGVTIFAVAQIIHAIRIRSLTRTGIKAYFVALGVVLLLGFLLSFSPIYIVASIYACGLIHNLSNSRKWAIANPDNLQAQRLSRGFLLFILCDTCVAVSFLTAEGLLSWSIAALASVLVYVFYLPSQILLASTSGGDHHNPKNY